MDELKPCPFCGCEVRIYTTRANEAGKEEQAEAMTMRAITRCAEVGRNIP